MPPSAKQSRTGCKFLTGQGVKEGAAPLCRKDFFLSLLWVKTIIQWCIAKNRGGYTLETRHRRCRVASAEGARIEAPRHISAPQKPSSRRLLKFSGPEICLVETMHYGVYGIVKCEKLLAVPSAN